MSLEDLLATAQDKTNFKHVEDYIAFARRYLDFVFSESAIQAIIVSQNEPHYRFFQYKEDGHYGITRPFNSNRLIKAAQSDLLDTPFLRVLDGASGLALDDIENRSLLCNAIYTFQQSIGDTVIVVAAALLREQQLAFHG